ncbi:MAG: class I SAM-dependent methyltransferase [Gemmatimonadales bacterium]|nr:class I SAM-dependent methyltransferase [Gemmatimonadales bacterium]
MPDTNLSEDSSVHSAVESRGIRSVCDLGCGIGRNLIYLATVKAIDFGFGIDAELHDTFRIDDINLDRAVWLKLKFIKGDWRDVAYFSPPIPYGLCFSNNVLEHLPKEDADDFIATSLHIAPLALHVLPIGRTHWDKDYHLSEWTLEDFRALLERHGKVVEFGRCGNGNMTGLVKRRKA